VGYEASKLVNDSPTNTTRKAKLIANGLENWRMRLIGPRTRHGMSDVEGVLCSDLGRESPSKRRLRLPQETLRSMFMVDTILLFSKYN
jgi:hypothetical protein